MSMHTWPVYGFGIVVTDADEMQEIAELNGFENPCELADIGGFYFCMDDCDGINVVYTADEKEWHDGEYDCMLAFYAEKQPKAFSTAYANAEAVVEEFKNGEVKFPDDFDFDAHIAHFSCAQCG